MNWQNGTESDDLSVGKVSERTGLSARTLRYYEELGLLPGVLVEQAGEECTATASWNG